MFKVIRAHSLQDANYLFKTFHEGRLGNTRVLTFEGMEKSLAELLIKQGVVDKVTTNVWKGTESRFKEFKPAISREKRVERSAQKEINKLSEYMFDHFPEIGEDDALVKDGIVEIVMDKMTRLLQNVIQNQQTVSPPGPAPELDPAPTPVKKTRENQKVTKIKQHPENHPDFDPAIKTEV